MSLVCSRRQVRYNAVLGREYFLWANDEVYNLAFVLFKNLAKPILANQTSTIF